MRPWYHFWQCFAHMFLCAFFRVRIMGRKNVPLHGPVLLLSNHQSFLDPILCGIGLGRELDYIARDSLFGNKLFGWYIRSLNTFPIQRGQADIAAIKTIINRLRDGRAVVLFPEATRTADGRIRPIKAGFELIARKGGATVVPVLIDGAFEAWPRTRPIPGPCTIKVLFGRALGPDEIAKLSREQFVGEINLRLRTMQQQLRQRYKLQPYNYK